jgi:hypothetical protein
VAKTRRPAKKGGASKGAKAKGKKPAPRAKVKAKKPSAPKAAAPKEKTVHLKELRKQFGLVLGVLSAKQGASPEVDAKLDDTRKRISQWMTDIDDICTPELQEICGPDMAIPVP